MEPYIIKSISKRLCRIYALIAILTASFIINLLYPIPILANSLEVERAQLRSFAYNDCLGANNDLGIPDINSKAYCDCSASYISASTGAKDFTDPRLQCKDKKDFSHKAKQFCGLIQEKEKDAHARCERNLFVNKNIFFIVIGSEHYIKPESNDSRILYFKKVRGINNGAAHVAEILRLGGAKMGILLTSTNDGYVTREDVYKNTSAIVNKAKKSKNPFIFLYIAGHGIENNLTQTQFFVPGNLAIDKSTLKLAQDSDPFYNVYDFAIPILKLIDEQLTNSNIPYIALIDLCREKDDTTSFTFEKFAASFFPKEKNHTNNRINDLSASFKIVGDFFRERNIFAGYKTPVIFSVQPNQAAITASDPLDEDRLLSVGPLARRIILTTLKLESSQNIPLYQFVKALVSDDSLDGETSQAFTAASLDDPAIAFVNLFEKGKEKAVMQLKYGSGKLISLCCDEKRAPKDQWSERNY